MLDDPVIHQRDDFAVRHIEKNYKPAIDAQQNALRMRRKLEMTMSTISCS
jgi:hypothetical protein